MLGFINNNKLIFYLDFFKILILKSIGTLFAFLSSFFIARDLAPVNFGFFSFFNSTSILISSVLLFGLDYSIIREVAENSKLSLKTIKNLTLLSCFYIFLIFLIFLIFVMNNLMRDNYLNYLFLFIYSFLLWIGFVQQALIESYKHIYISILGQNVIKNLSLFLFLIFIIILLDINLTFNKAILFLFASQFTLLIFNFIFIKKIIQDKIILLNYEIKNLIIFIKKNLVLFIIKFYIIFESLLPLYLLYLYSYEFDAGIYAFSFLFYMLMGFPYFVTTTYVRPRIANAFKRKNISKIIKYIHFSTNFSFRLFILSFLLLILFLDYFLDYFFIDYVISQKVILIFALAQGINSFFGPIVILMIYSGSKNILLRYFLISFFFLISVFHIFNANYHIAASISFLTSVIIWNCLSYRHLKKSHKIMSRYSFGI